MSQKLRHIAALFCIFLPVFCAGQVSDIREKVISSILTEEKLVSQLTFLSDSLCAGRATASPGSAEAAAWIMRQYRMMHLSPIGESFTHSFRAGDRIGHNIIGMTPASAPSDEYIVIMAHYDNLGMLGDRFYPGADSNASGVVAMLNIAHLQNSFAVLGKAASANVIYVALDAKQLSMAGASALYDEMAKGRMRNPYTGTLITPKKIKFLANLDILGSSLAPVTAGREDFLIMLGGDSEQRRVLSESNYSAKTYMQLAYDYYGSKDFTDLFLNRISDQRVFIEHKVKSIMFTSGITMSTNKIEDNVSSLNIPVFRKRILLIYTWLESILK